MLPLRDYEESIKTTIKNIWDIIIATGFKPRTTVNDLQKLSLELQLDKIREIINAAIDSLDESLELPKTSTVILLLRRVYKTLTNHFEFLASDKDVKDENLPNAIHRGLVALYPNALLTLLDSTAITITDILALIEISTELFEKFHDLASEGSSLKLILDAAIDLVKNIKNRLTLTWGGELNKINLSALVIPASIESIQGITLNPKNLYDFQGIIWSILSGSEGIQGSLKVINQLLKTLKISYEDIEKKTSDKDSFLNFLMNESVKIDDKPKLQEQILELLGILDPLFINDSNFKQIREKILENLEKNKKDVPKPLVISGGVVQAKKLSGLNEEKQLALQQFKLMIREIYSATIELANIIEQLSLLPTKPTLLEQNTLLNVIRYLNTFVLQSRNRNAAIILTFRSTNKANQQIALTVYNALKQAYDLLGTLKSFKMISKIQESLLEVLKLMETSATLNGFTIQQDQIYDTGEKRLPFMTVTGGNIDMSFTNPDETEDDFYLSSYNWEPRTADLERKFMENLFDRNQENSRAKRHQRGIYATGGAPLQNEILPLNEKLPFGRGDFRIQNPNLTNIQKLLTQAELSLDSLAKPDKPLTRLEPPRRRIQQETRATLKGKLDEIFTSFKTRGETLFRTPQNFKVFKDSLKEFEKILNSSMELAFSAENYFRALFSSSKRPLTVGNFDLAITATISPINTTAFLAALTEMLGLYATKLTPANTLEAPINLDLYDPTEDGELLREMRLREFFQLAHDRNNFHSFVFDVTEYDDYEKTQEAVRMIFGPVKANPIVLSAFGEFLDILKTLEAENSICQSAIAKLKYVRPGTDVPQDLLENILNHSQHLFSALMLLCSLKSPQELCTYEHSGNEYSSIRNLDELRNIPFVEEHSFRRRIYSETDQ